MIGVCVYDCQNKNSYGYCKTNGCINPDYINTTYYINKGEYKMKNENVKMSSPWVVYFRELEALFGDDPDIRLEMDDVELVVKMYVENQGKAEALSQLLPSSKHFGNVELKIQIIPANDLGISKVSLFQKAFDGNPILSCIRTIGGLFSNDINYVVFKKEVVQYHNDDIGDLNGVCSTLYQDIAKDVFGNLEGIFFCTDIN